MATKDLTGTALFADKGSARPTALATSERRALADKIGEAAGYPGRVIRLVRRSKDTPAALPAFGEALPIDEDPNGTGSLVDFTLQRHEANEASPTPGSNPREAVGEPKPAPRVTAPLRPVGHWRRWGRAAAVAAAVCLTLGIWMVMSNDDSLPLRGAAYLEAPQGLASMPPLPAAASRREVARGGAIRRPGATAPALALHSPAASQPVPVSDQTAAYEPATSTRPARPEPRPPAPGTPEPSNAAAPQGPLPPTPGRKPQPGALTGPGYQLQLFAGRNPRRTDSERTRLASELGDLLGALPLQVVAAEVEGYGTFYRIRTGTIADRQSANALCQQLQARDQECLPIKVDSGR